MEPNAAKRRDNKKSLRVKVISLGNAEVGKSCIIKRYCEKRFVPKYLATIGIDYGVTKVQVRDREIKVNIFDMAGHPFFYEVRNEFYKDSQGVLLVFDVGVRESFSALDSWLGEMKQETGSQANMESIVFTVCANKVRRAPSAERRAAAADPPVVSGGPVQAAPGGRGGGASVGGVPRLPLLRDVGSERRGHQRDVPGLLLLHHRHV